MSTQMNNDALVHSLEQERLAIWNSCPTDHERHNAWENRKATLLSYLLNDPATPRSIPHVNQQPAGIHTSAPHYTYPQPPSLQSITSHPFQQGVQHYTTTPHATTDVSQSSIQVYDPATYVSRLPQHDIAPGAPLYGGHCVSAEHDVPYPVALTESCVVVPGTQLMTPSTSRSSQCSNLPTALNGSSTGTLQDTVVGAQIPHGPFPAAQLEPSSIPDTKPPSTNPISAHCRDASDDVPSPPYHAIDMQRTDTNVTSSTVEQHTAKRRRKHVENAKQSIAPRRQSEGSSSGPKPLSKQSPAELHKAVISRNPYSRPAHPKLYCNRCDEYPNGFRGDHELRRHYDRAHAELRKVWICVEPAHPSKEGWWPTKPVGTCKQCKRQKQYNVYYNAAAHLRRAHFCPRKRGRRPKGEEREARAGKAGGDWPPIDWLKTNGWLKEIEVSSSHYYPPPTQPYQVEDAMCVEPGNGYPTPPVDMGYPFSSPVAPLMEHTVSAPSYSSQHPSLYQDASHLYEHSHFGIPIDTPYAQWKRVMYE